MEMPVGVIYNEGRDRRIVVGRIDQRSFGFNEQEFCTEDGYPCWILARCPASRFDSLESALREAKARIPWSREATMEQPEGDVLWQLSW